MLLDVSSSCVNTTQIASNIQHYFHLAIRNACCYGRNIERASISAITMLNRSTVLFGERALFAGAIVIIEGNSKKGLDYLSVRFACDPMRTTIAIHVNNLDPISATEETNVSTRH